MSCGCDWGSFETMFDELAALGEMDRDARYGAETPTAVARGYERSISQGQIQADILAAQVAGYK